MSKREEKILTFCTALSDAYREDEKRELNAFSVLKFEDKELTEDFYCMFRAIMLMYSKITDEDCDQLDFLAVLNRLIYQFSLDKQQNDNNDIYEDDNED